MTESLCLDPTLTPPVTGGRAHVSAGVVSVLHFVSYFVRHFSAEELQGDDFNALVAKKNHLLGKRIREIPGTGPSAGPLLPLLRSYVDCHNGGFLTPYAQICSHGTRRTRSRSTRQLSTLCSS